MIKASIKNFFHSSGIELKWHDKSFDKFIALQKKYRDFTMVPSEIFKANLDLCVHFKHLNGDYVECGVWRGGMSAAIAEILEKDKMIYLFDSFEGLPQAKEIEGIRAMEWQRDVNSPAYYDNCKTEESFAHKAMQLAGHKNYSTHKGWFNQTLPEFKNHSIAILRLDGDWYDSIMVCMDELFPQVIDGGIVLIDDYYVWDGCSKAIHDYLSKVKSASRIYQWDNQVAYIIKQS